MWEPLSETRAPAPPSPPRGNGAQPKKSFIFIYMCDFLGVFVSSCRVIFFPLTFLVVQVSEG